MKEFLCFSSKLCSELCKAGFRVIEVRPNSTKPWLKVFIFEDSKELREIVNAYSSRSGENESEKETNLNGTDILYKAMNNLKSETFKMWLHFVVAQRNNIIKPSSTEVHTKLGISRSSYYRGMAELKEKGYIFPCVDEVGALSFYSVPR